MTLDGFSDLEIIKKRLPYWKIALSLYSQIKNEELLEHIDRVGVVI